MTAPTLEDRLADLDEMLALAKARPFPDWDREVIGYLTERRYALWLRVMDARAAAA